MRTHPLTICLHPSVTITDPERTSARLLADINRVFAPTNRRFVAGDSPRVITDFDFPGAQDSEYPTEDFLIIVAIEPGPRIGQGWTQVTTGGVAVVRMQAPAIPVLDSLNPPNPQSVVDWDWFVFVVLHELGHNFGVAIGEIYHLWNLLDPTEVHPLIPVDARNPNDIFWKDHQSWLRSPMMNFVAGVQPEWSDLDRRIIDGPYRMSQHMPPDTDLLKCRVVVEHEVYTNDLEDFVWKPQAGARVRIWHVDVSNPESRLLVDQVTGPDGIVEWAWAENESIASTETARLIKVHCDGYEPSAGWVTVYDAQEAALGGAETFTVPVRMVPERKPVIRLKLVGERLIEVRGAEGLWLELMASSTWFFNDEHPALKFFAESDSHLQLAPYKGIYRVRTCSPPEKLMVPASVKRARHQEQMAGMCKHCSESKTGSLG